VTGSVNDAQRAGIKLQFIAVDEFATVIFVQRIGILAHLFVKPAHRLNLVIRNSGALEQAQILFVLEPRGAMAGLPAMHEYFGILCFIAQRSRQSAVILVGVGKHDAPNVAGG